MLEAKVLKYDNILNLINKFLNESQNSSFGSIKAKYFQGIEQEAEKLINVINDGVVNVEIFEKIGKIYRILIVIVQDDETLFKLDEVAFIFKDLFFIFKFLVENIVFTIEQEFL